MDKVTSDERLLKLIEGSGEHKQNVNAGAKKILANSLFGKLKFNPELLQKFKVNLFNLNRGLIGLACLLTLLFLFKLFTAAGSSGAAIDPASLDAASVARMVGVGQNQNTTRKISLNQEIKRNIFLPFGVKSATPSEEAGINLTEEVKDLRLVGIIWSENPEVMIETAKDSRTYTLKKGELFSNGKFKIKEITNNSVTLEISVGDKISEYVLK